MANEITKNQYRQWFDGPTRTPQYCDLCPLRTICCDSNPGDNSCVTVWTMIRANLKIAQSIEKD